MENRSVNQLRRMYLEFFESKDHLKMDSFSLVPHNDNSLLLINAGMAPLKPYFTGQEIPPRKRVTTCQKCVRTGDIDNVGKTARHLTFFEMLGNFSFGDYFKREAINWSWEFLTQTLGMDPERLYPSVYGEDDEAFDIWNKEIGIDADRITRFYRDENGDCDNFWEHGAGPCGPCSEIYYDRGVKYGCGKPDCKVGCECDRFMEVWNNVFTQFEGDGKGNYTELENKNIDTGMGLERLAVVVQDVDSVFDIDTMKAIRDCICDISGKKYAENEADDVSIRVITDHMRSATFMISDGIMPSNEGRGYVLRRLIRRAASHGRKLGIEGKFLYKVAKTVIDEQKDGYPELGEREEFILKVLTQEEEKFAKTIDTGLRLLNDLKDNLMKEGKSELSGEDVFKLYDTYGFPSDLTMEILAEDNITIDEEGFKAAMNEQKERARSKRKVSNYMGADETVYQQISTDITSEFDGYDKLECDGTIVSLTTDTEIVEALSEGEEGTIITDVTPFYATMGGQQFDIGYITTQDTKFEVQNVITLPGSKIGHIGKVISGVFRNQDKVHMSVDEANRRATACNHSATHILQQALRDTLGSHVAQAGSYVDANRLRFDFSHFQNMTLEEIEKVERIVNSKIAEALPVNTSVMTLDEARKTGAMALFGEKYGESVRVVKIGDYSTELCGGTHVSDTSTISYFKIISEKGISAGVRRIEALTGVGLINYYNEHMSLLADAAKAAKTQTDSLVSRIEAMNAEIKALSSENEKLKAKLANNSAGDINEKAIDINGIKFLAMSVPDMDMNELRNLGDSTKEKLGDSFVVLMSAKDGKVSIVSMATDAALKKKAHAGNLIKQIASLVGGGGGGRPNMAQAGGKDPSGIEKALEAAVEKAKEMLA